MKVEPAPTWLFTHIRPPWSSMNFRERANPSPVPSCFAALVPTRRNSSNTYPGDLPSLLRTSGERRKNEADSEYDCEPDQPHAAGSLAERHDAHQHSAA